jgi:hypothetical protein
VDFAGGLPACVQKCKHPLPLDDCVPASMQTAAKSSALVAIGDDGHDTDTEIRRAKPVRKIDAPVLPNIRSRSFKIPGVRRWRYREAG